MRHRYIIMSILEKLSSLCLSNMKVFIKHLSTKTMTDHQLKFMAKGLPKQKSIDGVKTILLVASGKGGVGKSTTAVNLATAIKTVHSDKNVGLLDADVFGPSIPLMMNIHDTPLLDEKNRMMPLNNYGIQCMSMGFLIEESSPVIWRGLMVMQAIDKLLRQVSWNSVDYLIIDTPPGTGDTMLSLVQNLPVSGVLLVTTPQTAALQVAKKGAGLFKTLSVPVIGVVENMSSIKCPSCAKDIKLFSSNTEKFATEIDSKVLVSLPLEQNICSAADKGIPIVVASPESLSSKLYKQLAQNVITFIEEREINN